MRRHKNKTNSKQGASHKLRHSRAHTHQRVAQNVDPAVAAVDLGGGLRPDQRQHVGVEGELISAGRLPLHLQVTFFFFPNPAKNRPKRQQVGCWGGAKKHTTQ